MSGRSDLWSTKIFSDDLPRPLYRYTEEAARRIGKLDKAVKARLGKAILRLADCPELGKRLTGHLSGRWSYRVGDWRILYKVKKAELLVLVLTVGHRSGVYDP